jgi:flavorubredoxin
MIEQLTDGVHWVGVVDWGRREFHGHELSTHRGTSYNAYLIQDEKTALVDTVWSPFSEEFAENICELVDPKHIDYVIANHAEIDHSGSLPQIMQMATNAQLICSPRAQQSLAGHFHEDWDMRTVKTGETISLGERELVFIEAPMLHWPDSMFTYVTGDNILMPNDAFGQHYATAYRFNDQVDQDELFDEALKYYVNILTPFSDRVLKKIDELVDMDVPVDIIAPSHGVIWRDSPMQIVEAYQTWAKQEPEDRAVILYDTMWHGTRRMAEAIGEGLAEEGMDYKLLHMSVTDRNDALVQVFRSKTVIVGSPTLNNGLLPTILPILIDLKGLKFKNKLGAGFCSYGWSGEALEQIESHFEDCNIPLVREGIRCKWQPGQDDLQACREYGREIAQATRNAK